MSRMNGCVLLVGSVPGESAAAVLRLCGPEVGSYTSCLPDGETGYRQFWITFLAATVYHGNPALDTVQRPRPLNGKENWYPQSYDDQWQFQLRADVPAVYFARLGYAAEAQRSYRDFYELRRAGVIPPGVRFQVSLPLTESAVRPYLARAQDFTPMWAAYEDAMGREIQALLRDIPAQDLAIQWDICMEVLAIEVDDQHAGLLPWKPPGDPFERYVRALQGVARYVPEDVLMGCHLCYGDLGHQHFVEPRDLELVVRMANAAHNAVSRPIDYYHMPVPRNRDDDAYVAPLQDLTIGDATLYLGLIHYTDGVEGSLRRMAAAKRHLARFGIATECGFGRRDPQTVPALLRLHRAIAERL